MRVLRSNADLQAHLQGRGWRAGSGPVIVPTMGALHEGHARLIRSGSHLASSTKNPLGCIVWIFVNPTQFNDPADLARYPRTLDADMELCDRAGAAAVFAPSPDDIYPPDMPIPVPSLPRVATAPRLEDAHRPGHFAGVCQVVNRFFALMRPAAALFGEKDWQQLAVIRAMVAAEGIDTEIVPVPTVREPDGLAMSSRNRFLDPESRARAAAISRALCAACGERVLRDAELAMRATLLESGLTVDYATIRDAATLLPVPMDLDRSSPGSRRALIAARIGGVRLIDNASWAEGSSSP